MKRIVFVSLLVVAPVVLFLLLAEGLLRLTGFGYATAPLIKVEAGGEEVWVGNPDFTRLYFPAGLKRLPSPVRVPVEKDGATRRYMLVGGSAAAGDPDTDFSIARNLEWMLSEVQPDVNWEIINLAYTACNSHVAAEVVRQSGPYGLDGVLVLVGNNEVIGPFGPGTTLTEAQPTLASRNLTVALRKTQLGQLGQMLREALASGSGDADTWRGMGHFLEHRIPSDDPRLEQVYDHFQANLEDMERMAREAGLPILLANVPVNLLDQPPFLDDATALPEDLWLACEDYLKTGLARMSPEEAEAAAAAHPQSAYLAYMTGRILFEAGKVDRAHAHLRRARDLDLLRFRADSRINGVISAQWERADSRWIPVDTEKVLIADSPKGTLGFPHFYEHVHFSQRANFIIARAFARALLSDAGLASERLDTLTWGEAASGLAYTTYEAWLILEEIEQRFGQAPFTSIPGYERVTAWMDSLREALYTRISSAEEKERSTALYQAAISRRPHDDRLKLGFANFLIAFARPQPAFQLLEGVYARNPTDSEIAVTFFKLAIELNQLDAAEEALARIETLIPGSPNLKPYREDLKKAGR